MNEIEVLLVKSGNEDLLQEGYIGLMKAIKSYDNSKDVTFSTFANLCIKRQIITAIKSSNSIKYSSPEDILLGKELAYLLNEYLKENLTPLEKKVCSYMYKQYKYNEIAEILDESPQKIDNAIQRVRKKVLEYLGTYTKK